MACYLRLVRLADFAADVDELDLLTDGFDLADDGYMPVAAPIGAISVSETITLKITGSSKDDLADALHLLEDKIREVQWWLDNPTVEPYQVWLRKQLNNESLPSQVMLLNIVSPDRVRIFNPTETNANYIGEYTLGITRTAHWEDPYPYPTTTDKTSINCIGGMVELSETINGDVAARLARLDFKTGDNQDFGRFWAGWRSSRLGVPGNFEPVWSLSEGQVETDTTSGADVTAYNGNALTCTFGTVATLTERVYVRVSDVSANPTDQVGRFAVLLRAKMSDASIARVRAKFGWVSTVTNQLESPIIMSRQVISGTDWTIFELGSVNMPPIRNVGITLENFGVGLDAERISGSGSLLLDCLVFIPTTEGFVKLESASNVSRESGSKDSATVFCAANMAYNAVKIGAIDGLSYDSVVLSQIAWTLPANSTAPWLVMCGADKDGVSTKADTLEMSYVYIPRWRTLRGNVT